jgi:hypothetical protein
MRLDTILLAKHRIGEPIFTRLRAKGKPYKVAIIAVVNKLLKQLLL